MEWSRSSITAEEMERRQREYIEAAMKMAKKAAINAPAEREIIQEEPKAEEIAEIVEIPEVAEEKSEEEDAVEAVENAEVVQEVPEITEMAEENTQNEEKDEEKTTFGVFDKQELEAAAENGTVSDEGLKRAAEILAEMSEKTEEMKRVYGQTDEAEKPSSQPQSLGGYVNRHNGGSCPRCGQAHNGSRR